ncbi:MAG TPA: Imm5 family immunity protein [Thermoanaerobaculia bacterium]
MNNELQTLITRGRDILANDPDGHLPLGIRQAIWATLDRDKRVRLAIASARRVAPSWNAELRPAFTADLLEAAEVALSDPSEADEARELADEAWTTLLDVTGSDRAILAGFATVAALIAAAMDEQFDANDLDLSRIEEEDPESRDAAAYAAMSAAGGELAADEADPEARREFWNWWLNEAAAITR